MKVFYSRIHNKIDHQIYIQYRGVIWKKQPRGKFFYNPTKQAVSRAEKRLSYGKLSELNASDALVDAAVAEGEAYWKEHNERTSPEPSKKFKSAARELFESVNIK